MDGILEYYSDGVIILFAKAVFSFHSCCDFDGWYIWKFSNFERLKCVLKASLAEPLDLVTIKKHRVVCVGKSLLP